MFSEDEKLKKTVENLLGNKVNLVQSTTKNSINSLTVDLSKNTEVIFDNNFCDFKSIIESMEELKNSKCTFKILPKNSDFIIGSNNSNDRGKIIKIEKHQS